MEQITIGQIGVVITFSVGLISGTTILLKKLKEWIGLALEERFESIDKKIDNLQEKVDKIDMNTCKNFLVRCFPDIENGNMNDETEKARFWEQYKHYVDCGGNSYILRKVELLKLQGKL